ncbi:MAG: UDP-N-acetylmuramoyl-tripeptide--D-alanyl-D-alanine ligase [Saprospiraceae bacterium]
MDRITTDSRSLVEGDIFLALKGNSFDGNEYVEQALNKKAEFVIADNTTFKDNRIIVVPNSYIFLIDLARHHRKKLQTKVIAITGTNGKTTTKELVYHIFKNKYKTLATFGNFNNHIGVPLTLLKLKPRHEFLILEMGANRIGDIAELCHIAEPDSGIITNIGKAHLQGFGNLEGVLKAKTELFDYLQIENKPIFYNFNSTTLVSRIKSYSNYISYGNTGIHADYEYQLVKELPTIELCETTNIVLTSFHSKLFGIHNYENIIAAITIAHHFKIENELIQDGLDSYQANNMRSQIVNYNHNIIILDAYNANPSSMQVSIESFIHFEDQFKWLILGAMAELGEQQDSEHQLLVNQILNKNFEKIILVGAEFEFAKPLKGVLWFDHVESCKIWLDQNMPEGKLILIKGSRSIGLEKLVIN